MNLYDETRRKEAEWAANALEKFVNSYTYDVNTFIDKIVCRTHRTLQQSIGGLVFALIRKWAEMYRKDMYDLRNEQLCQVCHNIDETMTQEYNGDWTTLPTI
ncbi:MAG: hypothetical protein DRO67_00185 [Candidatus Asgardarchaeum californiense]|nr:MAG: hypothetical protein DRO67_00185 [Candidatus Asgardarchaeum californiense]